MATIQQYYNISSSSKAKWLKNGEFVYLSDESGVSQIWKRNPGTGESVQLTHFKERVWSLSTSGDGETVYFTMDRGGNEQEQIVMLDPSSGEVTALTDNDRARHQFGGALPGKKTILFSCNGRNPANFDLCALDTEDKKIRILYENTDNYNMPAGLSPDGHYFLYNKLKAQSDNCLWMLDTVALTARRVNENGPAAQYSSPAFVPDGTKFYLLTDADSDFVYLALYDIASDTMTKVYEENWDLESISLSRDGRYLAILINRDGYSELEIMDVTSGRFLNLPKPPKGVMGYYKMDWSFEGYKLLFTVTSGTRPAGIWMLDLERDSLQRVTASSLQGIAPEDLVEPELFHYTSYDGLTVPFWFYRAAPSARSLAGTGASADALGNPSGNVPGPVVLDIHGGPEGQERPMFTHLTEYLVSQGFSVAAPNVRGSVGYGKHYHHLDDVEKRMDSVKDIEALVNHLIETGMAEKGRIAVTGGSYGGFMTLASITEYPGLFAAAVDIVGISNFETFLANTAEYRRAHRESEYGSLALHRDILRAVSPIHKIGRITTPLMVIHGANDPRVPVGEAEQIVESLESRKIPVEYLCYADEGHGLSKRKNQLDCYPRVCAFLKKHLNVKDE